MVPLVVTLLAAPLSLAVPVKYLGVLPLHPPRTALDVLSPGPGYGFPFRLTGYPAYPSYVPLSFSFPGLASPAKTVVQVMSSYSQKIEMISVDISPRFW